MVPGVVVKVPGPVSCEVLLSDERVVKVNGPVSCEVFLSDERMVKVTGPVSCEVLVSDERVVRRHVDHIQRRHTDRPEEAERQFPPSVPEATHLPDDSHGTPECSLDNEIQPRQSEYPRERAARSCGCNSQSVAIFAISNGKFPPIRAPVRRGFSSHSKIEDLQNT